MEYSKEIVRQLRTELASDTKELTDITLTRSLKYERFDVDIKKCMWILNFVAALYGLTAKLVRTWANVKLRAWKKITRQ